MAKLKPTQPHYLVATREVPCEMRDKIQEEAEQRQKQYKAARSKIQAEYDKLSEEIARVRAEDKELDRLMEEMEEASA